MAHLQQVIATPSCAGTNALAGSPAVAGAGQYHPFNISDDTGLWKAVHEELALRLISRDRH